MLGPLRKSPEHQQALDRVKSWTRQRFGLAEDATIFVAEIVCAAPGCPPLETIVAFWTDPDKRHHLKIFKPVAEVVESDLPPAWMRNALLAVEIFGCECC
jgi:hypothetical protein